MSPRTVAGVSGRHTQRRLCIGVHNSSAGVRSATLRSNPHEAYKLYDGAVVYDGPRPRPQYSETTFASVNGSRALTTGAARPSDINLYLRRGRRAGQHKRQRAQRHCATETANPGNFTCKATRLTDRGHIPVMRGFHRYVSVPPFPYRRCSLQKYVRITFIRKNSVRIS